MASPAAEGIAAATLKASIAEVERQFAHMLAVARRTFKEAACMVHPSLQPLGFTVMTTLFQGGECQQGAVAETLQVDKALLSRTVTQLEGLGLVCRRSDPSDGRAQLLALSEEGRARLEASHSAKSSHLRSRLESWDPDEVQQLAVLLGRLNERL